jgi:cellobiose-specific phosphotransferase system component IIB
LPEAQVCVLLHQPHPSTAAHESHDENAGQLEQQDPLATRLAAGQDDATVETVPQLAVDAHHEQVLVAVHCPQLVMELQKSEQVYPSTIKPLNAYAWVTVSNSMFAVTLL